MNNTGKSAIIEHIVTDMGNGGAYCSLCSEDLNHGDPLRDIPGICPGCGARFVSSSTYINSGGSDF